MIRQISAIYENGVLKPMQPLNLPEHARVEITVDASDMISQSASMGVDRELAAQQQAWDELRAAVANLPRTVAPDRLSNRDHDQILYGGKS